MSPECVIQCIFQNISGGHAYNPPPPSPTAASTFLDYLKKKYTPVNVISANDHLWDCLIPKYVVRIRHLVCIFQKKSGDLDPLQKRQN